MLTSVCVATIRPDTIGDCLRSIRGQTISDWEVIVVGQGPDEATLAAAVTAGAAGDHRVRYLHLERKGLSAARNVAIAASRGDVIAFTDDDCEADPAWLEQLRARFVDGIDVVCGAVYAPASQRRGPSVCPEARPEELTLGAADFESVVPSGFGMLGANLAFRRSAVVATGRFDEALGAGAVFGGGEEHDYVTRVLGRGGRLRSTPAAIVHHTHGRRHGIRAVWRYQRDRIRGDGGLASKHTLLEHPDGDVAVVPAALRELRKQSRHASIKRLPYNAMRWWFHLTSYVHGLRRYELVGASEVDPDQFVLSRRS